MFHGHTGRKTEIFFLCARSPHAKPYSSYSWYPNTPYFFFFNVMVLVALSTRAPPSPDYSFPSSLPRLLLPPLPPFIPPSSSPPPPYVLAISRVQFRTLEHTQPLRRDSLQSLTPCISLPFILSRRREEKYCLDSW